MKHACATRRSSDLPWGAEVDGGGVRPPEVFILDADGKEIALVYATDGADEPTAFPAVANSRLMVEAPAMKATIGALARRLLALEAQLAAVRKEREDRKSTRLNSSH